MKWTAEYKTAAVTKNCPAVFEWCGFDKRVYKNDTRWYRIILIKIIKRSYSKLRDPLEPNNNGGNQ